MSSGRTGQHPWTNVSERTMELLPGSQQHHWGCGSDSQAEMPHNSDLLFCSGFCHLPGANPGSRPCSVHTLCWDHYSVTLPPLVNFPWTHTLIFFSPVLKRPSGVSWYLRQWNSQAGGFFNRLKKNFMRSESSWVLSWDPFRSRLHKTDNRIHSKGH